MKSSVCSQCGKSYASSQSLWNHKQRCEVTKPSTLNATVGEKRKANGKYASLFTNRFPALASPSSDMTQHTKTDIIGYSDDDDESTEKSSSFRPGPALVNRIVNGPSPPPAHVISDIPVIRDPTKGKGLFLRGRKGKGFYLRGRKGK